MEVSGKKAQSVDEGATTVQETVTPEPEAADEPAEAAGEEGEALGRFRISVPCRFWGTMHLSIAHGLRIAPSFGRPLVRTHGPQAPKSVPPSCKHMMHRPRKV